MQKIIKFICVRLHAHSLYLISVAQFYKLYSVVVLCFNVKCFYIILDSDFRV